jgi:putative DNA methylase
MHFVTFRLAGTLPQPVLNELREQKDRLLRGRPPGVTLVRHRETVHKLLFARYDEYLDGLQDVRGLDDPRMANLVRDSLYHWHGKKYGLVAYCVMPNHVHLLIRPFGVEAAGESERESQEPGEAADAASPLAVITHSLKSYTAHGANTLLGRTGQFWQHESYDHWARDDDELERIVAYIDNNPVKAGLASRPHEYRWCSAYDRHKHKRDACAT